MAAQTFGCFNVGLVGGASLEMLYTMQTINKVTSITQLSQMSHGSAATQI